MVTHIFKTQYYRNSVFPGDSSKIKQTLREKLQFRDQALVATSFELGSRIAEVMLLKKDMFTVESDRIVAKGVPIVKRWRKGEEYTETKPLNDPPKHLKKWHRIESLGVWLRIRYKTKPVLAQRSVLEIPLFEPLAPIVASWLDEVDDWLFPSYAKGKQGRMTETRAYQIVRDLGERIGLRKYDYHGKVINQHVTPHWFRAMRASQLASEYGWRQLRLKQFFGWVTDKEPSRYATLAPADLFESMRPERIRYEGGESA